MDAVRLTPDPRWSCREGALLGLASQAQRATGPSDPFLEGPFCPEESFPFFSFFLCTIRDHLLPSDPTCREYRSV